MIGTLTQDILNYIKLKISKKDAMRVSSAVVQCAPTPRQREAGLPPLSPPRRLKKIAGKT